MKFKQSIKLFFVFLVTMGIISCSGGCSGISSDPELQDRQYAIADLAVNDLYYRYPLGNYIGVDPFDYVMDSLGVEISQYLETSYYNPVNISARGLNFYDRYINIPDSIYRDYAFRHRDALVSIMNEEGYFEYRMDYYHFDINFLDPWYSGMAQGLALSLFSFLAYFEQDSLSECLAHKVYKTLDPYDEISHEVVHVDSNQYAWIEEYPGNPSDHTFNGFMFAVIGLYDYYRLLNNDENVNEVLSVYLTTIMDNMYRFRNPGAISFYCLRHEHTSSLYHRIHIRQLDYFSLLTNDNNFNDFADTLRMDYWNY